MQSNLTAEKRPMNPKLMRVVDKQGSDEIYSTFDGHTMAAERHGPAASMTIHGDRWVLRDPQGIFIDADYDEHMLVKRHGFVIQGEI